MRAWGIGSKGVFIAAGWMVPLLLTSQIAIASPTSSKHGAKPVVATQLTKVHGTTKSGPKSGHDAAAGAVFPGGNISYHTRHGRGGNRLAAYRGYRGYRGPTLQCVAYARSASNISLAGNAADWWDNASGVYARGNRPQPGSVLAFTANGRMRLGHVAVVSRVINGREIEVDHANWGAYRGAVARGVPVVDVSENNDWTAVRVGLSSSGDFGSVYPTYGFIYDRPDNGVRVASSSRPAPVLALNPAPSDLRPGYGRQSFAVQGYSFDEVAEAPATSRTFDRPDRSLR
jgi:surface antigen